MSNNQNGLAWGSKAEANALGCYYYYNSSTAVSPDPRGILIHRPGVDYYDWEANFYPHVGVDYSGLPVLDTNEPDNADTAPDGMPYGDDMTPEEAVIFTANAIRRWPNAWFVGPNIVRQTDWLRSFLTLWQQHGRPLTGRSSPFTDRQGRGCWGCHVYGNGVGYAKNYVEWFTSTVKSFGHRLDYLWVSEYGTKRADEMEAWTRYFNTYTAQPIWFAVFAPYLAGNAILTAAYKRGLAYAP